MKILIIEDEMALAKAFVEKFKREGFEVNRTITGEEGIELSRTFKPDIIILDILLPGKNGIEILREFKSDEELKDIPIVMASNLGGEEDIQKCLSLGAKDYFVKSQSSIKEIVEKIKEYVSE